MSFQRRAYDIRTRAPFGSALHAGTDTYVFFVNFTYRTGPRERGGLTA